MGTKGKRDAGSKRAVPRHRKQVAASADRQERQFEKRTRREGKVSVAREALERAYGVLLDNPGPRVSKGPWKLREVPRGLLRGALRILDADDLVVLEIPADSTVEVDDGAIAEAVSDNLLANARLMATAPELREALMRLVGQAHPRTMQESEAIAKARAALEKAAGKGE